MKHKLSFTGISRITMSHDDSIPNSRPQLQDVSVVLENSPNIDEKLYHEKGAITTMDGCKALANCFNVGLAACVKIAHDRGWMDENKFMEWIFTELTRHHATNTGKPENRIF